MSNAHYQISPNIARTHADCVGFLPGDIDLRHRAPPPKPSTFYWTPESLRLLGEIEFWINSRTWYLDREIVWKRGAMLKGVPGTGKTKMVHECAKKLGLGVIQLMLATFTDQDFKKCFANPGGIPRIVLIEDIDTIFEGRRNTNATTSLIGRPMNFDTLIDTIGGPEANGNFLIVTTNRVDVLDPALTRPGRLDLHIEVPTIPEEGRRFIVRNILQDWPDEEDRFVAIGEGMTAAEFENTCITEAITRYHASAPVHRT